ncbi:hypothetical protein [Tissierella sp. Yu-01]|uniref:hypothetical protein n=1 Tax=Tissierella sp. Yu-01 TaxID=3035694 RepID=UPI00240E8FE0|nr:hypothetical protein [Tissierella sp. Yu-01]WFA08649.1 hypothetical protein P3962_13115 [Tissierella sp. Yu-01]
MELKNCIRCNSSYDGEGELCTNCKFESKEDKKMTKLEGTIDALATLRAYKEVKR